MNEQDYAAIVTALIEQRDEMVSALSTKLAEARAEAARLKGMLDKATEIIEQRAQKAS